jgi:hypothetical protein
MTDGDGHAHGHGPPVNVRLPVAVSRPSSISLNSLSP